MKNIKAILEVLNNTIECNLDSVNSDAIHPMDITGDLIDGNGVDGWIYDVYLDTFIHSSGKHVRYVLLEKHLNV